MLTLLHFYRSVLERKLKLNLGVNTDTTGSELNFILPSWYLFQNLKIRPKTIKNVSKHTELQLSMSGDSEPVQHLPADSHG